MADLQIISRNERRSHGNPRIDLTPMVDLGFLLITFFMMTTTMAKPGAMEIQMPFSPSQSTTAFYESSAITLIPAKDHRIYYYEGLFRPQAPLEEVHTGTALRSLLQHKQQALRARPVADERHLQVLIKAHATATVTDIVNLFDEMNILGVRQVAMVDIYPEEAVAVDSRF